MQRRPKRTDCGKREEIEGRPKWEDLNTDCLVNIFLRVDMENMLLDIPYVCKSWYKVTCTPQCWTTLNFTDTLRVERYCHESNLPWRLAEKYNLRRIIDQRDSSALASFIRHVVKRSNGLATFVELPSRCEQDAIIFISKECPNLKTLLLPVYVQDFPTWQFPSLVSKWKRLEKLRLCWSLDSFEEIIVQIGLHCNKFEALEISKAEIGKEEASALGAFLPNLKVLSLSLRYTRISKENMLVILNGCKKLEVLDATYCLGFHEGDDDILKSASHITRVNFEGSRLNDDNYEDYDHFSDGCRHYGVCNYVMYNYWEYL